MDYQKGKNSVALTFKEGSGLEGPAKETEKELSERQEENEERE